MKYPRPMHDAASRLTDKEYRFIRKEFGITKKELLHLSEDLLIELYDELCNIEATLTSCPLPMRFSLFCLKNNSQSNKLL